MRKPPSGTVTLLFTDIEASTRLWERHPGAMASALRRHDALLRSAIESSGGYVFKTVGDAFCAAFDSASAATSAAVLVQQSLSREPWPPEVRLRVRIALHSGQCEERDGDYFGPVVNRTARLEALAHGGQVLLTGITARLASDGLPTGVGLVDLGSHRLKDLDRVEEVFQLSVPGLPIEFPPLRTVDPSGPVAVATNLRAATTSFVGREDEVAQVRELVRGHRLVSLTGPGGVGKSRLAGEAVRGLGPGEATEVWLIDLGSAGDADQLASAVAVVIGARESEGNTPVPAIIERLRDTEVILVLDNCEHIAGPCADLVTAILQEVPGARVLATTRERLGPAGEVVWRVEPLPLPSIASTPSELESEDTVRLFVERARSARRDFSPEPDALVDVAHLCRMLDGLPLAIELAAARVTTLSPAQIVARLERGLSLLSGGSRDAPERQRTLRAAIAWSYELLTEPDRLLLQYLSVFRGGCTLEAAEVVGCADVDTLQSLVDKSLVSVADERFTLLETIREFAGELLDTSGAREAARRRHAEYFAGIAPELGWSVRATDAAAVGQVQDDYDNFLGAFEWGADHGDEAVCARIVEGLWYYWVLRGLAGPGYRLASAALADATEPPALYANLLAELARSSGNLDDALDLKRQALARYEEGEGPEHGFAATMTDLAEILVELGRPDEAEGYAQRALDERRRGSTPGGVAHALQPLVLLALDRGQDQVAIDLATEALSAFRDAEAWPDAAFQCAFLAAAHRRLGRNEEARVALVEGQHLASLSTGLPEQVAIMEQVAALAAAGGDDDVALRLLGAARSARSRTGNTFRVDESALTIIGTRMGSERSQALLDEGGSWNLESSVRVTAAVLDELRS